MFLAMEDKPAPRLCLQQRSLSFDQAHKNVMFNLCAPTVTAEQQ